MLRRGPIVLAFAQKSDAQSRVAPKTCEPKSMFAGIVISSGSMPAKWTLWLPARCRHRRPSCRKRPANYSRSKELNKSPKKHAVPISTARRRAKDGNKSQASLDFRSNSTRREEPKSLATSLLSAFFIRVEHLFPDLGRFPRLQSGAGFGS